MTPNVSRQPRDRTPIAVIGALIAGVILAGAAAGRAMDADRSAPAPGPPPPTAAPAELTVYAAASLGDVLEALRPACESAAGAKLVFNLGASSDLARQILAAAKADVFFSADDDWMDKVAQAGLLDAATPRSLLSNRLVVVGREGIAPAIASAADLAGPAVRHLSLANPEAVPAGKYAKAWLVKAGVWDKVQDRVVPALDVRAALAAVESGGAEVGVVYRTDAMLSRKARILYEVPEQEVPAISYPVAALVDRPHLEAARALVACLASEDSAETFRKFGFIVKAGDR